VHTVQHNTVPVHESMNSVGSVSLSEPLLVLPGKVVRDLLLIVHAVDQEYGHPAHLPRVVVVTQRQTS